MFSHYKKSASVLTDQNIQMVGNDRWPATICNTEYPLEITCPQPIPDSRIPCL